MKKGDKVVIEGHPPQFDWMTEITGKVARIESIRRIRKKSTGETATICRLSLPGIEGDVHLSARYLAEHTDEEK